MLVVLLVVGQVHAAGGGTPSLYCSANERLGFGVETDINAYEVERLHAGWYVKWGTPSQSPHPAGLDYVQVLRVCDGAYNDCWDHGYWPYGEQLASIVAANPGNVWLVGNEPDCPYQDNTRPERYAVIYHDVYEELKRLDPTAQVAIGGITQATPLRLRWLDRVWQEYQRRYGQPMPVDVWNVHAFVLREERGGWGCGIPPGLPDDTGELRGIDDLDRMDLFAEQIVRFRQWMADHGQRDKPLIVTEYGILFNEELGYSYERVRDYMLATFDYFLNATDPNIGYPADGDRLVQRWAWFSLDVDSFGWGIYWGALFDPQTHRITQMGQEFGNYAARLVIPYVDLFPQEMSWAWVEPLVYGQSSHLRVTTAVANWGNTAVQDRFVVRAWLGQPGGGGYLGQTAITWVPSRYAGHADAAITGQVMVNGPIDKVITVRVDPTRLVPECNEDNNQLQVPLAVDVDVALAGVRFEPVIPPLVRPGETVTATAIARVVNEGDVEVHNVTLRFEAAGGDLLDSGNIAVLPPGGEAEVEATWPERGLGVHVVTVTVDPDDQVRESDEANNVSQAALLVASERRFFPWVAKKG